MPSREEHNRADADVLGVELGKWDEVHKVLDQFAHYPDMEFLKRHRKFLHHEEGIEYIRMRFGEEAGRAAELHVKMDCGHIPRAVHYYTGTVDQFGYQR